MTIIVTGAGGFVGRPLVRALLARGETVVAMDQIGDAIDPRARIVTGDICQREVRERAFADGCKALIHLATLPGGAAEADPAASRRINLDAMYDLLDAASRGGQRPRVVYASTIAVFGDPLPEGGVDDFTPLLPRLVYGGHKAMMETAMTMLHQRGQIDAVSVRLPGILARPKGPSGMKSAFMSDLFHALRAHEPFVCPVSPQASIWAQSVATCVDNLIHALDLDSALMPPARVVTLPALRLTMGELAQHIAAQTGTSLDLVTWQPDQALQAMFGAHPSLATPAADRAGFLHDGDAAILTQKALEAIKND